jgi:hypothetical protein
MTYPFARAATSCLSTKILAPRLSEPPLYSFVRKGRSVGCPLESRPDRVIVAGQSSAHGRLRTRKLRWLKVRALRQKDEPYTIILATSTIAALLGSPTELPSSHPALPAEHYQAQISLRLHFVASVSLSSALHYEDNCSGCAVVFTTGHLLSFPSALGRRCEANPPASWHRVGHCDAPHAVLVSFARPRMHRPCLWARAPRQERRR